MSNLLVAFIDGIRRQVTAKRDVYRHDGIGNPIVSVDLYLKTALEACEEIERLGAENAWLRNLVPPKMLATAVKKLNEELKAAEATGGEG